MTKKSQSSNKKYTKSIFFYRVLCMVGVSVIIIIAMCFLVFFLANKDNMTARSKMTQYLKEKYGEEFTIDNLEYKGGGIGIEGSWQTEQASPLSDKSIRFYVGCNSRGCSDTYLDAFFSKQEYERLKPAMEKLAVDEYSVHLIVKSNPSLSVSKDTSLTDIKQKYDPIYKLQVSVKGDLDDAANKIMPTIDELYSQGVSRLELDYAVARDEMSYVCTTDYEKQPLLTSEVLNRCLKPKENE